jgi:hypothetical protein
MIFETDRAHNPPTMQIAAAPRLRSLWLPVEVVVRRDVLLLGTLLFLGALVPIVLGSAAGSLDIPRNDDWSFRRIAMELHRSGRIAFDSVAEPILLGQLVLVQPFLWLTKGGSSAFALAGMTLSVLSTLTVYGLARLLLTPARSFLATLSVVLFPGFLAYVTSFMTDVPAMTAQLGAVALAVWALKQEPASRRGLAAAMLVAVLAFSIRQVGLAAVGAVAVAAIAREPRRRSGWSIAIAGVAGCAAIVAARLAIPGDPSAVAPQLAFAMRIPLAAGTVGLMALPAALVSLVLNRGAWRWQDAARGGLIGAGLAFAIGARWVRFDEFPNALIGNLTSQLGVLDVLDLTGGRPYLFTDTFWTVINLLGVAGIVVLGVALGGMAGVYVRAHPQDRAGRMRDFGTPLGVVAAFTLVDVAGLLGRGATGMVFDRYLWSLLPALAILLLAPVPAASRSAGPRQAMWGNVFRPLTLVPLTVVTLQAIVALILMLNSFAFDAARWHAGETLVSVGLDARTVDAGYEWVGSNATMPADMTNPGHGVPPYRGWWPQLQVCGLVTASPVAPRHDHLVAIESYQLYLFAGPDVPLYLYRSSAAGCA